MQQPLLARLRHRPVVHDRRAAWPARAVDAGHRLRLRAAALAGTAEPRRWLPVVVCSAVVAVAARAALAGDSVATAPDLHRWEQDGAGGGMAAPPPGLPAAPAGGVGAPPPPPPGATSPSAAPPAAGAPRGSAALPRIPPPPGTVFHDQSQSGSASDGVHRTTLDVIIDTNMPVADIEAHVAGQLTAAGWTREAGRGDGTAAVSTWILPGAAGQGALFVWDGPGPGQRSVHLQVVTPAAP